MKSPFFMVKSPWNHHLFVAKKSHCTPPGYVSKSWPPKPSSMAESFSDGGATLGACVELLGTAGFGITPFWKIWHIYIYKSWWTIKLYRKVLFIMMLLVSNEYWCSLKPIQWDSGLPGIGITHQAVLFIQWIAGSSSWPKTLSGRIPVQ